MGTIANNPILSGFYPDPSICAVGEDFYLISSTFAYFPGIPVMHSKDLAHWEQAGNVLTRNSQLPLENAGHSQGIFAPTIRYHEGVYYVICTNVSHGGNFIVTATKPEGPWSEPVYIKGAEGIDPSLFFDEDGRCYYIGTHPNPSGVKYNGDWFIWIQELDLETFQLIGEPKDVWNGAMKNIIWPEGPHIYKRNGYYYIMNAEGGTGPHHAVTVCRSKSIWGPYENNFCNPIITHRHLGKDYPVKYVGHADLVETVHGDWYMVMLAVRPENGFTTMGRETFLAEVIWEDDWPVVNPGKGILTEQLEVKLNEWNPLEDQNSYTYKNGRKELLIDKQNHYDFANMDQLGDEWLTLRNADEGQFELIKGKGLVLHGNEHTLKEQENEAYIGIRQRHHKCRMEAVLDLSDVQENDVTGVALLQSNEYHARVELSKKAEMSEGTYSLQARVIICKQSEDEIISEDYFTINVLEQKVTLGLEIANLQLNCKLQIGDETTVLAEKIDIHALSTEVAGGFVGETLGVYVSAKQREKKSSVCIKEFSYEEIA